MFWGGGPFLKNMHKKVLVKIDPSTGVAAAKVKTLKMAQQFLGARLKKARRSPGFRYLLGLQAKDSKRIFLEEADVFRIELRRKPSKAEAAAAAAGEKQTYGQLKGAAVAEMGTKARQQVSALAAARAAREYKIVEFGGYKDELKRRAEELSARVVSVEERDAELKAKLLPPFNASATNPWDVYKEALEKIAPSAGMQTEDSLITQDLQDLVKASTSDQIKAAVMREQEREVRLSQQRELQEITEKHAIRSRFLAAVVKQRAKAQM